MIFIVEAFRDAAAGAAHVATDHFEAGTAAMSEAVAATPQIIHADIEATGWSEMGEVTPRPGGTP
jgi:quinol monooxygenase YgiN